MTPPSTAATWVEAAQALAPQIRDVAEEIERARRLPQTLVKAMAEAGLFRLLTPAKFGGCEVDVVTMVRVIEEVSKVDGSAGWIVMTVGSISVISAYLDDETAHEVYGSDPLVVTSGVFAPKGKAIVVDGRVSGDGALAIWEWV